MPWGRYGSYRKDTRTKYREGSFDLKLKVIVYFLRVKSNRSLATPPQDSLYTLNASDKNFKIAIFIEKKTVERSDNKNSVVDRAP